MWGSRRVHSQSTAAHLEQSRPQSLINHPQFLLLARPNTKFGGSANNLGDWGSSRTFSAFKTDKGRRLPSDLSTSEKSQDPDNTPLSNPQSAKVSRTKKEEEALLFGHILLSTATTRVPPALPSIRAGPTLPGTRYTLCFQTPPSMSPTLQGSVPWPT